MLGYSEDVRWWRQDLNFMFEWQEQNSTSEGSEQVRYENIKLISSCDRVMFFFVYGGTNSLNDTTLTERSDTEKYATWVPDGGKYKIYMWFSSEKNTLRHIIRCVILRYKVLCYATLCYVKLRCAMLWHVHGCPIFLWFAMLWYIVLCCAVLRYVLLCFAMFCHVVQCCAVVLAFMFCLVVLYSAIFYDAVQYCSMLGNVDV